MIPLRRDREVGGVTVTVDDEHVRHLSTALIVDDDLNYARKLAAALEQVGFECDIVEDLGPAKALLLERRYMLFICDNIFRTPQEPRGSEFLVREHGLVGGAETILLTGFAFAQIVDRSALADRGIRIVPKAPGHVAELRERARTLAQERVAQVKLDLERLVRDLLAAPQLLESVSSFRVSIRLIDRALRQLREYLEALPDQDTVQFYIRDRAFSPRSLRREIDEGSDTGVYVVDMLLDDILEVPEVTDGND